MKQQRNTVQRRLVLDAVLGRNDHPGADAIYNDVRRINDKISRGTVYRNLNLLARSGEILQIKTPAADRYDFRTDKHYHIVCTACGSVCDAPVCYNEEYDMRCRAATGYLIINHSILFEGLCPECREKQNY